MKSVTYPGFAFMFRYLLFLASIWIGAAASAAPSPSFTPEHFVRWDPSRESRDVEMSGLVLHVQSRTCGNGRPVSEACAAHDRYMVVTVEAPGLTPATLVGEAGVAGYIGIGRLGAGAVRPSVILITEDGGSAGCVQIDVAVSDTGGYRAKRLSVTEADHGTLCHVDPAHLAWPRDLSGHGRAEFLMADGSFYCAFTSCAGTWYPPRVIAFDGRRGIDVSNDPALAPLFREDMRNARVACANRDFEAQGACAGYAADAGRLGLLPEAWPLIDAQARRYRIPAGFLEQLSSALRNGGYLRGQLNRPAAAVPKA